MICKAKISTSFSGLINYCLDKKKGAKILMSEGVFSHKKNQLIKQFESIAGQRPNLKNAVWHGMISFSKEEKISNDLMVKIAKDYLKEFGIINTQVLVIRHFDKQPHAHLVINRISFDNKVLRDWKSGYKAKMISNKLEKKHGLIVAEDQVNKRKESISIAIEKGLSEKEPLSVILKRIEKLGYQIKYNKGKTGAIRGVSFLDKERGINFKSSSIDRKYSYSKLLLATTAKHQFTKSKQIKL